MQEELANDHRARFILGDIRDSDRLFTACEDIDMIFHAAAFKHVPQGEFNPFETIQTNVLGTQNLISVAFKLPRLSRFTMVSTDKAVAPGNTMGASKLLAERLISAAHNIRGRKEAIFTTVRFGNVLGSSGSVVPLFREQAKKGEIVVTHPDMHRFFLTIPDAVKLTFDATMMARGGEVFVLKMPAVRIQDLAEVCAERFSDKPVKIVSGRIRPGERLHEALMTDEEFSSSVETAKLYIILAQIHLLEGDATELPYEGLQSTRSDSFRTSTAKRLNKDEIRSLLDRAQL